MIRHTCNPFHATEAEVAACPGCQAGDTYEGWRARAEALAGALDAIAQWRQRRDLPIGEWAVAGAPIWERAEAALARLPAQALAERQALELSLELAWGVIANAGGGDWSRESADWQSAAIKWRDQYFSALDATRQEGGACNSSDRSSARSST